jgi:hypothetical protein
MVDRQMWEDLTVSEQKQSHTRGPWEARHYTVFLKNTRHLIAGVQSDTDTDPDGIECEANARLIAAAPTILSELMDAERWLSDLLEEENVEGFDEAIAPIRAAIAGAINNS